MNYSKHHRLMVRSERPPLIELDPECGAVYVRFKTTRVSRTVERTSDGMIITVDLDRSGEVIGVEAICFDEFTIANLLQRAKVDTEGIDFSRARIRSTQRNLPHEEMVGC